MLIDGYNLLRTVEKISDDFKITDVRLCIILSEYLRRVRKKGKIIFDGIGPPDKSGFAGLRNLEVLFSGPRREADDVIERLIADNTAPKRLVVVSSDRRIKTAAKRRKATATGAEEFWAELIKKISQAKKRKTEPQVKYTGIDDYETKLWLKEFGLDNQRRRQ